MLLSVIIVNWNAGDCLLDCLTSVYSSELLYCLETKQKTENNKDVCDPEPSNDPELNIEVILVDNASSDDSIAKASAYPQLKLKQNTENLGFSRAVNQGLKMAAGDYILLLNPDTVLEKDTLRIMTEFMENNSSCGIAGCRVLNEDGSLQLACRRNIPDPLDALSKFTGLSRLFPNSRRLSRYNLTYIPADMVTPVDAVSGSFLFIRRKVVETIGPMDERFFMYGEDLDWCLRSLKAGYTNYYVPHTSIIHHHGHCSRQRLFRSTVHFHTSMLFFYNKHSPSPWLKPLIAIGIGLKLIVALLKAPFIKKAA